MKQLLLFIGLLVSAIAQMDDIDLFPSSYSTHDISGIKILDAKVISFQPREKIAFTEISGLAYDSQKRLYALSDQGSLFRLEVLIEDKKIKELSLLEAMALRTKKGKPLKDKKRDAEGMAVNENGLLISFEHDPKVSLFSLKGEKIKDYPLNKALEDIRSYQTKNKALEALVEHPVFGLITAPELPLRGEDESIHTLYALNKTWQFKASGSITSVERMPDDNLLVLERDYHLLWGHTITLKKVRIMECQTGLCPTDTLASLKTSQGWRLDNFEGMTYIKDNLYLMISDDNGSFFQKCILVLFEVKK